VPNKQIAYFECWFLVQDMLILFHNIDLFNNFFRDMSKKLFVRPVMIKVVPVRLFVPINSATLSDTTCLQAACISRLATKIFRNFGANR
jgi:hypothetical protein